MAASLATPVSLTIRVKPFRCGSAPTAPAPPRNTRCILPQEQQNACMEDFHASWPVLPANRRKGREVNFPRLNLNVQHRSSKNGSGQQQTTPSPLAMLAFQRAFQKMKQQASVKATTTTTTKVNTTTTTAAAPPPTNKPVNASQAAALERLNAMAPSSSSSSSSVNTPSPRKLNRRRHTKGQCLSPQTPTNYGNNFSKTSTSSGYDPMVVAAI